jgi:hypothetical protein
MFGSEILDVAIGLVFVYVIVSVICTAVREGIEAWLKTRASFLEHGIRTLLQDPKGTGLAADLFNHPLIGGLFTARTYKPGRDAEEPSFWQRGKGLPSYIPSKTFAATLLDIAAKGPDPSAAAVATSQPISLDVIRKNIANIRSPQMQRIVLHAVDTAQGDIDKAQKALEEWFDSSMDRVSGWYKRSTQKILFVLGLTIAVSMNIDSVSVVDRLYKSDAMRQAVVAAASKAGADKAPANYTDAKNALAELHLPIGWDKASLYFSCPPKGRFLAEAVYPWLGWVVTAIAATLGAPFWFDILNKIMVIRSTVKPHEKSPEEGSEDRQPKSGTTIVVGSDGATTTAGRTATAPPSPPPTDDSLDGCDAVAAAASDPTSDNQLPAATGGVL